LIVDNQTIERYTEKPGREDVSDASRTGRVPRGLTRRRNTLLPLHRSTGKTAWRACFRATGKPGWRCVTRAAPATARTWRNLMLLSVR